MVQLVERVFALLSEELGVNPQSLQIKWATYEDAQVARSRSEIVTRSRRRALRCSRAALEAWCQTYRPA